VRVVIRFVRANQLLKYEIVLLINAVLGLSLIIGRIVLRIMFVVGMEKDGEDKFVCVVVYSNQILNVLFIPRTMKPKLVLEKLVVVYLERNMSIVQI